MKICETKYVAHKKTTTTTSVLMYLFYNKKLNNLHDVLIEHITNNNDNRCATIHSEQKTKKKLCFVCSIFIFTMPLNHMWLKTLLYMLEQFIRH